MCIHFVQKFRELLWASFKQVVMIKGISFFFFFNLCRFKKRKCYITRFSLYSHTKKPELSEARIIIIKSLVRWKHLSSSVRNKRHRKKRRSLNKDNVLCMCYKKNGKIWNMHYSVTSFLNFKKSKWNQHSTVNKNVILIDGEL